VGARRRVFVYFTVELDEEEAGGRVVGQHAGATWEDALRASVPEQKMIEALALPRFVVIAGEDAHSFTSIERAVEDLREEFPDTPIVVGVDYLQAIDGEGREERARVSNVSKQLRKLAKKLGVIVIGVSQTSRANREKLRDGSAVGADTTTMGAETSQLERDAYVTLALGGFEDRPDGTVKMDLSDRLEVVLAAARAAPGSRWCGTRRSRSPPPRWWGPAIEVVQPCSVASAGTLVRWLA